MLKLRMKKQDIVLYIITAISFLNIISTSWSDSVRYKISLVVGGILFLYCTAIFASRNTLLIIRIAYLACVVITFSILSRADNIYDYSYAVFDVILWMLVMITTYGIVASSKEFECTGRNVYFCMALISMICTFRIFKPSSVSTYREWTSVLYAMYYPLCMLPLALLSRTRFYINCLYIKYSKVYVIGVVGLLILLSSKRGGFLALLGGLIAYYITVIWVTEQNDKKRIYFRNVILIGGIGVGLLVVFALSGNFSIFDRLSNIDWTNSGTSGRLTIWTEILSTYSRGTVLQKLFGFGYNATYSYTTISVAGHNDYINNLFDYGLIAILLQILLLIGLAIKWIQLVKEKSAMAPAFACSLAVALVLTMVSICISTSEISLFLGYMWGLVLGNSTKEQEHLTGQKNILLV